MSVGGLAQRVPVLSSDPAVQLAMVQGLRVRGWLAEAWADVVAPAGRTQRVAATGTPGGGPAVVLADDPDYEPDVSTFRQFGLIVVAGRSASFTWLASVSSVSLVSVIAAEQSLGSVFDAVESLLAAGASRIGLRPPAALLRDTQRQRFTTLTRREQHTLGGLILGRSAEEIATDNGIATTTVRTHIHRILGKLEVSSQVSAVALTHHACADPSVVRYIERNHQF